MKFKDSDLTPIYPPEVKPERVGEYLAHWLTDPKDEFLKLKKGGLFLPAYWDGLFWFTSKNGFKLRNQNQYWRGLNRDPMVIAKERGE